MGEITGVADEEDGFGFEWKNTWRAAIVLVVCVFFLRSEKIKKEEISISFFFLFCVARIFIKS